MLRWLRHRRRTVGGGRRPASGEGGFTVVESAVALGLVFTVLVGLLATMGTGVRGLVAGRQRTGAVAIGRQVIEQARAALYRQLGHDLAGDSTLADDPDLVGSPPAYEGEALVGAPDPQFPQHRWTTTRDETPYTAEVYVTWVDDGVADPYKRITVVVGWAHEQYTAGVENEVRLSSLLFAAGVPPDPRVDGNVEAEAGTVEVTGSLSGVDLQRAVVWHPTASGGLTSLFVREARGLARSSSAEVKLNSGPLSGCDLDASGLVSSCAGVRADTAADSDTATPAPEHDAEGPMSEFVRSVTAGSGLTVTVGSGRTATSTSTARSCFSCFSTPIGDDDRLAHHSSEATGSGTNEVAFDVTSVRGSLFRMSGSAEAAATLDQDAVDTTQRLASLGDVLLPALDVVSVEGGPSGFGAAAEVVAVDADVSAEAGPTASVPSTGGGTFTVRLYDTLAGGSLGYRSISLSPGQSREETAGATFDVGGATVTLTTALTSGGRATSHATDASGTVTSAEASLTNWLRITVRLVVVECDDDDNDGAASCHDDAGAPEGEDELADVVVAVDYGRLVATATWEDGP